MTKRLKMTTTTTLIVEALTRADDFMTAGQLIDATGRTNNRVTAALHHLRKHRMVAAMAVSKTLYWYATPGDDTRIRTVAEKAEEDKPRKARKPGSRSKKGNKDLLS